MSVFCFLGTLCFGTRVIHYILNVNVNYLSNMSSCLCLRRAIGENTSRFICFLQKHLVVYLFHIIFSTARPEAQLFFISKLIVTLLKRGGVGQLCCVKKYYKQSCYRLAENSFEVRSYVYETVEQVRLKSRLVVRIVVLTFLKACQLSNIVQP